MIGRNTENFTGFIIQDKDKVFFHAENKIFNFIAEGTGVFASMLQKTFSSPDHFLHGYTTDGYQLALYTGYDERKVSANYKLKPGIYIISRANMCSYDMTTFQAIEFVGGTLNNLCEQKRIETKYDLERGCYIKIYPESKKEFQLRIRNYDCRLVLRNAPSETDPSKMDLILKYEFPNKMPLATLKIVYNVLIDICRFMTNRKNVGFDEVRLFQMDDETGKWLRFADGFIDYQYESFTQKSYRKNILFDYMDDCIAELHSIVSSDTEGESTYLFGFYAENDKNVYVLPNDRVKNICSSVECELDFAKGLKDEENENLKALISQIKKVIKDHRKSERKLEDKTYDMIGSSMSHWGMANSRKIFLLFLQNKTYMDILKERDDLSCTEEDIAAFVKYRNDVTHGRYRTMDSVVATTAYVLIGLTYCCFLKRIGMKELELKKLFEEGRIDG